MFTIVKFRPNHGTNAILSRTLRKVAVIDNSWSPLSGESSPSTTHDEFWLVDIVRETHPGKALGCFIVRPIKCVARVKDDRTLDRPLLYLLPGMYTIELITPPGYNMQSVLLVTPTDQDGRDWTLPLDAVQMLTSIKDCYALVVNLGGSNWRHVRSAHAPESVEPGPGGPGEGGSGAA